MLRRGLLSRSSMAGVQGGVCQPRLPHLCMGDRSLTSPLPNPSPSLALPHPPRASHLTNDAVQKLQDNYGMHEDHCKLDLEELQAALGASVDIRGSVWPQVRECVRQLFGHTVNKLNPKDLRFCFELLGLDFMIDAKGQVGSCRRKGWGSSKELIVPCTQPQKCE